jgi:prolyl-tRNA editing enzyme YbaK/EbsC (Cys-tRNA(Pro) deacylase)
VNDLSQPGIQRVIEVASRKGVSLDIRHTPRSTHTSEEAAAAVNAEVGQIVKSLVFVAPRPGGRLAAIVCLVSGRNQVDLRRLAAVSGEVDIRPATAREAFDITGYSVGSIPPFGHGSGVRIVMDQDLSGYQWVWAAAGTDKSFFRMAPGTLRMLSNALVAPVAKPSWLGAVSASVEPRLQFGAGAGA